MAAESRRRRRWVVPALLLGAGAGTWVIARRRSATEPVDVWAPRPPVERMIAAPEPAVPTPVPPAAGDEPVPAVTPLLATAPAVTTPATGVTPAGGAARANGSAPAADTTAPPFGAGSAAPLPDGSAPDPEYTIKGNASSRLFHPPSSPYYGRTKAEVWFRTADDAVAAGFSPYRSRRR